MKIRGIILAGGTSTRMGKNKLDLMLDGKKIVQIVINNATQSKLDELIAVYGKYEIKTDITKVFNSRYEEGMSTSIIAGLNGFDGDAVMLILGDMPFIKHEIIDSLYDAFVNSSKNIIVPYKHGTRGNPVIIGKKYFENLLGNTGDKGARNIIKENPDDIEKVEIEDDGIFIDVDDKTKYEELLNFPFNK